MLSSNNRNEQFRKQEPKKQRFTIKKLTVGVASVLIGFTFMGMSVSADTTTGTSDVNNQTESTQSNTDSIQTDTTTLNSSNKSASSMQNTGVTAAEQEGQNSTTDNATANQQANATALQTSLVAVNTEAQKTLRGTQTQEVSDWQGFVNAMNDKNIGTINLTGDINVTKKANGISNELINSGKLTLTGSNISGGLDINGQGHAINFGDRYLSFSTNNQKKSDPWDITFKNLTINADGYDHTWSTYGGAFSPIYMGGDSIDTKLLAQNKVTFENVTADVKNGAFYNTTMNNQTNDDPYTTVTFKGNNNITCEAVNVKGNQLYNYSSAVAASHIIFADGTTTFNVKSAKTNNDQNAGGNILRAKVENKNDTDPAIYVAQGATVNLNGQSTDVKGILTNSAITGDVDVDGTLNANMADGHSMAIWAGNLNIGNNGTVSINTKQDNNGSTSWNGTANYNGHHYAPIALGVGFGANVANATSNNLNIADGGTLKIVRTATSKTTESPLISFGSGASGNMPTDQGHFILNVNQGATLDLQDAAQYSTRESAKHRSGLISMWGEGSKITDEVHITNPKYLNLQRTGAQAGNLIRLEAKNNKTYITSSPVAQWDEANTTADPSFAWSVSGLTSQNAYGDYSINGFVPAGQNEYTGSDAKKTLLGSNANLTMGPNQTGKDSYEYENGTSLTGTPASQNVKGVDYVSPYYNQILNHFNWWTPQRISMGSALLPTTYTDSQKYAPEAQEITTTTKHKLGDEGVTVKDGIKDVLDQEGNVSQDGYNAIDWTKSHWFNSGDTAEYQKQFGNGAILPTNPTGDLKTTDTSATATIVYNDGSVDFVSVPLKVTEETLADEYTPSYKPVNVEQGKSATSDPSFTDVNNKPAAAPAGTTFAKGTDAPDWATIDPSTGTVTVAPGTDVTPGDYSIPVTVTYSDGSTDTANVPVTVTKTTPDADKYTPEGKTVSTEVGTVPDAKGGITNPNTLPQNTTYTWKEAPNVNTPGKKPATVVVTYPDGSKDEVPTNVIVNAKPEVKPINTTVNGTPSATDGIANLNNGGTTPVDGYPSGATWTTAPDTSKPGATTGTAEVTYPDGTKQTVTIPVAVNDDHDVTIIDDKVHTISLHANDVITHKTSETNIIGQPVVQSFKFSYYQGGQNYSKPYIYTLNAAKSVYELTQKGQNPEGVTVNAPESVPVSDIKVSWVPAGTTLFGDVKGNGQPTSVAGPDNGGTETIKYTGNDNAQANGYPKYVMAVDSSSVNWPIFGKGPAAMNPFPSVYIYGAKANGTIPSVNSDTTDVKKDLGKGENYVDTSDLTVANNSAVSSVEWQTTPDLTKANAKAPATVRINFTDGSHLDIPVSVNVIKVDQGVDNKDDHDLYRDITRTITVEGQDQPVVQHVIYSRAKSTDLSKPAGSQVTYTDWVAAKDKDGNTVTNFPQFEVTKSGYTATATGATIETKDGKQYVPASDTIGPDSQKETVNVTYTANEHTQVINYVDVNGNVIGTYNVPGKTGETVNVNVSGNVPKNWELVPGQQVPTSITFGPDDPSAIDVKIQHKTEVVPVDKNNKDSYREVVQTINLIPAGKTEADKTTLRTITVPFQRTGVKDLVTNKITWNAWQGPEGTVDKNGVPTYTIPAYDVKQEKGYDGYVNGAKATQVPTEDVNADSANSTFTITYVKQDSTPVNYDPARDDMSVTRTINYDVPAGHDAIAPVTQTVEYTRNVDGVAGYQDPVTGKITWNAWHVKSGNAEFVSAPVEQIKGYDSYVDGTKTTEVPSAAVTEENGVPQNGASVTVSYQKQDSTPVPYNPGKDGVNDDMNKYVTRTITVNNPDGAVTVPQTVHFSREDAKGNAGYKDAVSGETTWNAWHVAGDLNATTGKWAEYDAPVVEGYTANPVSVAEQTVTPDTPNATATINYTKVTNPTDADKYTPEGQDVTTKVGVVPDAEKGISNTKTLPEGTKYTWKTNPDVSKPGTVKGTVVVTYPDKSTENVTVNVIVTENTTPVPYNPGKDGVNDDMNKYVTRTITVNNPDGTKNEVPQTVHFSREDAKGNAGYKDAVSGETTWNAWHVAGDLNQANGTWDAYTAPEIKGYTADPASVAEQTVTADTPSTTVTINYHKDGATPIKWDGTKDNMYREVTRTITAHIPNSDPQTQVQTVKFTREDAQGNAGYIDPATGKAIMNAWHVVDSTEGTGTWGAYTAPVVDGYKASQDSVAEQTVTPETKNANVDITYTQTDAGKYTPQGQDVTTKVGVVPDAEKGISNTKALPEGTTYTWKETPDVTTAGDKPATVVVTYPDGSKDEVPVTVHVTNPSTPTNPTDADKYAPKGQDVTTKVGVVPDAEKGISNTKTLPEGTTYTWKENPDVTTAGDKPATVVVTYPDGSKDEVPVTVHVTNPSTPTNPTDADKYAPKGQDVTTKVGVVPDAEKGISNTKTLPEGTTYTWKETPDVTTPDDKPATVVVTYPDGSKDEVPVTVHVTNPTTPTNPTDADKYTPQGQDVNTKTGVVPDPAEGIKNKGDLPNGTKYTWKETPDVTTAGDKPATVVVTYPDGSKDEVPVTVHVTNPSTPTNPTDADKYTPQGQNTQNTTVVTNDVNGVSTTSENNTKKANTLPQTGNKQNSAAIAGLALTGFAAMFGLGGSKKKEK